MPIRLVALHFLLILLWLAMGCTHQSETKGSLWTSETSAVPYVALPDEEVSLPKGKWEPSTVRRFYAPAGLSFSNRGNSMHSFNDRACLVVNYGHVNRFAIYDWETSELLRDVILPEEGPDAILRIYSLSVQHPDSIWLHGSDFFRISLTNDKGKVSRRIDLSITGTNQIQAAAYSWQGSPIQGVGGNVVFIWTPGNYSDDDTRYTVAKIGPGHRVAGRISSFDHPQVEDLPLAFPSDYYDKTWLYPDDVIPRWDWFEKTVYVSFPISSEVIRYRLGDTIAWSRTVTSHFLPKTISPLSSTFQLDAATAVLERGYYGNIIHDEWNHLVYRLVIHPNTSHPYQADGTYTQPHDFTYSVQVMDSSLRLLGEYPIPQEKYSPTHAFASPQGFCLPATHPRNPGLRENELVYTCYQWVAE